MQNNINRPLKVYLCYSSDDRLVVKEHYQNLLDNGIDVWFNEESILPGQDWELEIPKAAKNADAFIIFLSNKSITKEGYVQKEIKIGLDIADEKPEGSIFIIPARLEECTVPSRLSRWQWVDLFSEYGFSKLMRSLGLRTKEKGLIAKKEEILSTTVFQSTSQKNEWSLDLTDEQIKAAEYYGSHARLLAGPGTGKTLVLTKRLMFLVSEKDIKPDQILVLTFTRSAADELKRRAAESLGENNTPRISTLHSFALRQLLRNSKKLISLPQPLRIADDWEEKNIIYNDLTKLMSLSRVSNVKELFSQLSSDWESLISEEHLTPPPQFIANWRNHRRTFGYTLRSELVYQLKRSLDQISDFELEQPFRHILIDEYQDLNKCDLSVIKAIETRNLADIFVAGDDDQSIYYFRKAHPEGIRNFHQDYEGTKDLILTICKRCDPAILGLAEFVASLDVKYQSKGTKSEPGKPYGEVKLLNFRNQDNEAVGIAKICKHLITEKNYKPDQILILLRNDRQNIFSKEIIASFNNYEIPITTNEKGEDVFDTNYGRQVISILRLLSNLEDHLAWKALIITRKKAKIGEKSLSEIYNFAGENNLTFYQAILYLINGDHHISFKEKLKTEYNAILSIISKIQADLDKLQDEQSSIELMISQVIDNILENENERNIIKEYLTTSSQKLQIVTFGELIKAIESSKIKETEIEQELEKDKVNILTMHKAKGLTADIVFIIAAEDEIIPGKNIEEPELGDERRLLFVSLTRAKHHLFISYCTERTGVQQRSGRNPDNSRRHVTQFLSDAPIKVTNGETYVNNL